ncbi:WYL domain-containing protein [Naasia lichenicola]|uniref:WYL domain-containing protein n=1 Tax=Naasia lichenicola TaxID=2565933 RepID=A0A4S4FMM6_9MICO|nr:WYL domain-containing protein [Naasia lichenicola]
MLAKLEQVLPSAVRSRVRATQAAIVAPGPVHSDDAADPETFATLALACRDSEVIRFDYAAADGAQTARRVESVALVPIGRRWYLLAWDSARDDWRTFRLDRITRPTRTHLIVERRAVPSADAASYVAERFATSAVPRLSATVRIDAPHDEVEGYLGAYTNGLTPDGPEHTRWRISDDRVEILMGALTWLIWPFTVIEGAELQRFVGEFGERLRSDPPAS